MVVSRVTSWSIVGAALSTVLFGAAIWFAVERDAELVESKVAQASRSLSVAVEHVHYRFVPVVGATELAWGVLEQFAAMDSPAATVPDDAFLRRARIYLHDLMESNIAIDHARVLSLDGSELVRVNRVAGALIDVPSANLQNKSHRDYIGFVRDTAGERVYIGPVTLNIEHGVLEVPYKPVLRTGAVIRNTSGEPYAMVIINHLDQLSGSARESEYKFYPEVYTVDERGEFLFGGGRFEAAEFRDQTGADAQSFAERFPRLFSMIASENEGRVEREDGIYRFLTSQSAPLQKVAGELAHPEQLPFVALVQFLPNHYLYNSTVFGSAGGRIGVLLVCLLYVGVMWAIWALQQALAIAEANRQLAEKHSEELEKVSLSAKQAYRMLREEEGRRSKLLSVVGHELRTPAATIAMLTEQAQGDPEDVINDVKKLSKHVLRLMDDLQLINRPELEPQLDGEPSTIEQLLRDAITHVAALISDVRMNLSLDVATDANVYARYDRFRIVTVVSNLIRNACLHSGGNKILVKACVAGRQERGMVSIKITVEDNGKGIPESVVPTIFDEFERGETSAPGMGLGLNIVKNWMAEIGGEVNYFRSTEGGAGFCVSLTAPIAALDEKDNEKAADFSDSFLEEVRILLVEDDAMVRRLSQRMLKSVGAEITLAEDGQQGLEAFQNGDFDLIITDYFMPNMSGVEMIKAIRDEGEAIPIVAVTAATLGLEADELRAAGADTVTSKPLLKDDFKVVVERLRATGKLAR